MSYVGKRCTIPVSTQIRSLAELRDGWLDGDGAAYPADMLSKAQTLFERLDCGGTDIPYIYPDASGAIRGEWDSEDYLVVVLEPGGSEVTLYDPEAGTRYDLVAYQGAVDELVSDLRAMRAIA